jgi:amidase
MDAAELAYAGVARHAELLAAGEVSSRELVELFLRRIERYNGVLNAFRVVLGERALMEADQADARRRAGAGAGEGTGAQRALLGVPMAVKDDMELAGEVTALGTRGYGAPASADSEVVRRLRAAGAVVVGKTNVPELCAFPWTESPTWGMTRNPWNVERTPGGSSGGSGAAVAAGLVGAALGSDGAGSIRYPAAYCGLFGLKGQRGRVPTAPHEDAFRGLGVYGVLTRTVADTALVYDVIADRPQGEGAAGWLAPPGRALRVAVATNLPPSPLTRLHPDNAAAVAETAELLRGLGHEVRERTVDWGPLAPPLELNILFLAALHEEASRLEHPERLERRMRAIVRMGGVLGTGAAQWARGRERAYRERLNAALADSDVLLTPVTPAPPPQVGAYEGRGWLWTLLGAGATAAYASPWNVTGQPAASVPAGFGEGGLPRAVQLVAPPDREATLVSLAAQIEAARPWAADRPPAFA